MICPLLLALPLCLVLSVLGLLVQWGAHVMPLTHLHALFAIAPLILTDSCVKCYLGGERVGSGAGLRWH